MTSQAMDYSTFYEGPSSRAGLKSNPKAVGYIHNLHVTIASVSTSFLVDWYCSIQTNDVFPLPADCIAPSDTMKASQNGRSFPDSLRLFSLYPLTKVYCVLATESYYVVMTGN